MSGFGFGISDFEYVANVILRVRNFIKGIKDAPSDFDGLRAEADCLGVCLKVLYYPGTKDVLRSVNKDQAEDLRTIIYGCKKNMAELVGFLAQCQRIAVDEAGGLPPGWGLSKFFQKVQNLWAKVSFVWKEKEPMREKLAIPTQSLNIYLVSLTFVSMPYNSRLSTEPDGGKTGQGGAPKNNTANPDSRSGAEPLAWADTWALVGEKVAFKYGYFSVADLKSPGIESEIVEAAIRIVNGEETGKSKPSNGKDLKKSQKMQRRKSTSGKGLATTSDRMYLVRSKGKTPSNSASRPSTEIVQYEYAYGEDSDSNSKASADGLFSPYSSRQSEGPWRGGSRADGFQRRPGDASYSDIDANHDLPENDVMANFEERTPGQRPGHDHAEQTQRYHERVSNSDVSEAAELRAAELRGYARARREIKAERKAAVAEMEQAMKDEARFLRESTHHRRSRLSPGEDAKPDVRVYMEVTYGLIINPATPEEQVINASRSRSTAHVIRERLEKNMKESEARTRHREPVADSDVSDDPDSGSEHEFVSRLDSEASKIKISHEPRTTSFAIPRTEYVPVTPIIDPRSSAAAIDHERELSLREREQSLRDREVSLREREAQLRRMEEGTRRQRSRRGHSSDSAYSENVLRPESRAHPQFPAPEINMNELRSSPRMSRRPSVHEADEYEQTNDYQARYHSMPGPSQNREASQSLPQELRVNHSTPEARRFYLRPSDNYSGTNRRRTVQVDDSDEESEDERSKFDIYLKNRRSDDRYGDEDGSPAPVSRKRP